MRQKLQRLSDNDDKLGFVKYALNLLHRGYNFAAFTRGAEEVYCDLVNSGLELLKSKHGGIVYLAANPVHATGVYKIGLTHKKAEERMGTLKTSGVLGSYIVAASWEAWDIDQAEAHCHAKFADRKIEGEFFQGHYSLFIQEISTIIQNQSKLVLELQNIVAC